MAQFSARVCVRLTRMKYVVVAALVVAVAGPLSAATRSWDDGGTDAKWTTAGNWDADTLPDFDDGDATVDGVVITTIAAGTATDLDGDKTVDSLAFTAGGDYSINNDTLTIKTGALTRNGSAGKSTQTINSDIVLGSNAVWTVNGNHSTLSRLHVGGTVSDGGNGYGLTKNGSRVLQLDGSSTYTGVTTANSGTFTINGDSDTSGFVIAGANTRLFGAATSATSVQFNGGVFRVDDPADIANAAFTFNGGRLEARILKANLTFNNPITVQGALGLGGTANITLTSDIALDADRTISLAGINRSDITQTFSGVISDGAGGPHKLTLDNTNRRIRLSGNNTHGGGTDVLSGTLYLDHANAAGSGTLTLAANTALYIAAGIGDVMNAVIIQGSLTLDTDSVLAGPITLANDVAISHAGSTGDVLHLAGDIGESGGSRSLSLASYSNRSIQLDGNNTFSGGLTAKLGGPPIRVSNDNALGTGTMTIDLRAADTTELQAIDQPVTIANDINVASGALQIGGSSQPLTYTGSISGNVRFSSNATLAGTGTVTGNVTMTGNSAIAPGASAGILTVNGDVTMGSANTFYADLDGNVAGTGYDQLIVNGTIALGSAMLDATLGTNPIGPDDTLILIANDLSDAIGGTFGGLGEGALIDLGTSFFGLPASCMISYVGGDGNDVILYDFIGAAAPAEEGEVPEPATVALLTVGLAAMARRRRRVCV